MVEKNLAKYFFLLELESTVVVPRPPLSLECKGLDLEVKILLKSAKVNFASIIDISPI